MVILVGVAGAGKSSQCALLKASGLYQWLSVGQLLREEITDPVQKQDIIDGKILSDQIVIPLVENKIIDSRDNPELVLDGYPRTVEQVEWLLTANTEGRLRINHVIHLEVAQEVAYDRLLNRGRSDDYHQAIGERFNEYRETIIPILSHFAAQGVTVTEIDGQQSIEVVHAELRKVLGMEYAVAAG